MFDRDVIGVIHSPCGVLVTEHDLVTFLEQELRRREWSSADFARRMGVSTGSVSMWMTRKRTPGPKSIERMADVLYADPDLLLSLAGHRPAIYEVDPDSREARAAHLVTRIDWDAAWRAASGRSLGRCARRGAGEPQGCRLPGLSGWWPAGQPDHRRVDRGCAVAVMGWARCPARRKD